MTTASPEIAALRARRLENRDSYANSGQRPPKPSPDVVLAMSRGGEAAAQTSDSAPELPADLANSLRAGSRPAASPGQTHASGNDGARSRPGTQNQRDTGKNNPTR